MIKDITTPLAMGQSSDYYTILQAEGFGSASVSLTKWARPGFHGIKIPRSYWRERVMRLVIGIRASDVSTYEQKRRELQAAFDLPRDGLTWLKFETQGGLKLQTQVHLNSQIQAPLNPGEVTIGKVRIELIAEEPVFYSQTESTDEITFASGTGTVNNGGNAPIFPTVRIHGNVGNPAVENNTLGRTVSISGFTVAAGEYLDLDMLNELVEDQVEDSKYSYIDDDDFFWLTEGDNTINLTGSTGGSGYRKVVFTYRDGYMGI